MFMKTIPCVNKDLKHFAAAAAAAVVAATAILAAAAAKTSNIVIYEALCFDVARGQMNGAPNETRAHSYRFARQAC